MNDSRIFWGFVDQTLNRFSNPQFGLVDVLFEELSDGHLVGNPKNDELFCPTGKVYITRDFDRLKSTYPNTLIRVEAIHSNNEIKDGDCRYISLGLINNKVSVPQDKITPCYLIEKDFDDSDRDPNIQMPEKLFKLLSTLDKKKDLIHGVWTIPIEDSINEYDGYHSIIPFRGKNDLYHKIKEINFSRLEEEDLIKTYFVDPYMNKTWGDMVFVRNKDILDKKGINKTYLTNIVMATLIKGYLTNSKAKNEFSISNLKNSIKPLIELLRGQKNILSNSNTPEGMDLVLEKLSTAEENRKIFDNTIENFLINNTLGKEIVSSYIEDNFYKYLASEQEKTIKIALNDAKLKVEDEERKYKQRLSEFENLITEKRRELEDKQKLLDQVTKEIHEVGNQADNEEKAQKQILERESELKNKLINLDDEIRKKQEKVEQLTSDLSFEEYREKKSKELDAIKQRINMYKEDEYEAKKSADKVREQLEANKEKLLDKINEMTPHVYAALRGKKRASLELKKFNITQGHSIVLNEHIDYTDLAANLVSMLSSKFKDNNRDYSALFIANILIVLQNNFISLVYGSPGIGKTSLIRNLSKVLGLGEAFLEINVAKGWDSDRDWIGFHNALQNEFVPARTEFYEYLNAMQDYNSDKTVMPLVLLDEANLSMMEHYWASFIGQADEDSERENNRFLSLDGGQNKLNIPNSLRFIGTINNDHTTQSISERIVSRAPIIVLGYGDPYSDIEYKFPLPLEGISFDSPISSTTLRSMFIYPELLNQSTYDKVNDLVDVIVKKINENRNISFDSFTLSARTKEKIKAYIFAASSIFPKLMYNNTEQAITDYVTAQFIIPSIRVNGKASSEALKVLQDHLNNEEYKISAKLLEQIIINGQENLDQYGMFNG